MNKIDPNYPYQVIDMNWFKENSVMMTIVTEYWQRGEDRVHWIAARNISDKLSRCRRFSNDNMGTFFVDAPDSMTDDIIAKALRALIAGNTTKVRF